MKIKHILELRLIDLRLSQVQLM